MSNIIQLTVPSRIPPLEVRITALLGSFADHRRTGDDVFWLKENAELLNILECTGQTVPPEALARHASFYADAVTRLEFFPQYYRFILSLALDLEDLGMPGNQAQKMVDFAARQGLAEAELSDLQRAEARRLMTRRGVDPIRDEGLDDRLRAFCSRTATFALPNKKAAYELTHIVYYLSEYGRRDPGLPEEAIQSLHFAGLTAFLDQNADLLAEICIALRYSGQVPPAVWTAWLEQETTAYCVTADPSTSVNDNYHEYLVCNWHQAVTGTALFRKPLRDDCLRFKSGARAQTVLRELSQAIYGLDHRTGDWGRMRPMMESSLSPQARDVLSVAVKSSTLFDAFFEGFARAGRA